MTDLRRDVQANPFALQKLRPAGHVRPVPLVLREVRARLVVDAMRSRRVRRVATVADHLGRYALVDLALRQRVVYQRAVGVGMHVDEAGYDSLAGRVDAGCSLGAGKVADCRYLAARNADVGLVARLAGAVDDSSVDDDCFEGHSDPFLQVGLFRSQKV